MEEFNEEIEKEVEKSIYQESFYEFFKKAYAQLHPDEDFDENWHHWYICNVLQKEAERIRDKKKRDKDIIINIPFRSTKSMMCTVIFPVWCWIISPSMKFITVSYSGDLATEHSGYSRDLINTYWFQKLYGDSIILKKDNNAKSFYKTESGGFRKAVGAKSQITGSGGDILLVDDPIDPRMASSEVERKNAIDFYNNTLFSRLNNPDVGVRIVVMQRLHEEDLTGHLINERPEDHYHIKAPGEITENAADPEPEDIKKYYKDGLFWPSRWNREVLKSMKKALGSKEYAGQMLQLPAPDEGGIIKREWIDIVEPDQVERDFFNEPIHFFSDTAFREKQENDPTALLACFVHDNCLYIINCEEQWKNFPDLKRYIPRYTQAHGYSEGSMVYVEAAASGISIVDELRAETMLNIAEFPKPKDDKVTRLNSVAPIIESKRVKLIKGSWNQKFIDQICTFPNAKHDDMTDCLVMATQKLLQKPGFGLEML